jgi:hypothetical protein
MPEPLNKVLEPVSVLHLDMPDDEGSAHRETDPYYPNSKYTLTRHGSFGAVEDPGVIGPVVWNMHCQRLQHGKIFLTNRLYLTPSNRNLMIVFIYKYFSIKGKFFL